MKGVKEMAEKYFVGFDIGTNSVGYAVTDDGYKISKFNGKSMWGVSLFDEAETAAGRRAFRTGRRRLQRRNQRRQLVRELFAEEIGKTDEDFYKRLDESFLYNEDKKTDPTLDYLRSSEYNKLSYTKTIHHLIMELIDNSEPHDIRLVYLAVSYIVTHRGHFLFDVNKENIDSVLSFDNVYKTFTECFEEPLGNSVTAAELGNALTCERGMKRTEKVVTELLFSPVKPNTREKEIIKAMCGEAFSLSVLFENESYKELENNKISFSKSDVEEKIEEVLGEIGDDSDLLLALKGIYDWSALTRMMNGESEKYISRTKVKVYEQHKEDLKNLKYIVKKYLSDADYKDAFKIARADNYAAYSYNVKNVTGGVIKKKATQEEFCTYLKKLLKDVKVDDSDSELFNEMKSRIDDFSFMPKQKNSDNRLIPYQMYWYELKKILDNAENYFDFLKARDESGLSVSEKVLSVFEFRIPYYVGPLNKFGDHAWIERKAGKIYPWNFEDMVDLDKSENAFIRRMTSKCSWLAGEDVLPKNSLLYSKFMALNAINKIKLDGNPITVEQKQGLYEDLFVDRKSTVTKKKIREYFISRGFMCEKIDGIDDTVNVKLKSLHMFERLIRNGALNEKQVEDIIARITVTTDKKRLTKWLKANYRLSDEDIKYISSLKLSDYGNLSEKLLNGIQAVNKETGELLTIIQALWETNYNLMELLSDNFDYMKTIDELNSDYYSDKPRTVSQMIDEAYVSPAVRRAIYRTVGIVKEIVKIKKEHPKKIFIEMARGAEDTGRTKSRKDQLKEKFKAVDKAVYADIISQLENENEDRLKSKKVYLYYMQLGRSLYTGEKIDFNLLLTSNTYDIDHIYPRARVKDDSFDNMALVEKDKNGKKSDSFPLSSEIRNKMTPFWKMLFDKKLISPEKFHRLTRSFDFTDEELAGFINRQIVETRQATKVVAAVLEQLCPNSEIVYVKARLASEFRHAFGFAKSRDINDLHHAKDAYLNIVMGNVYNVMFTKSPINFIRESAANRKYTVKLTEKKDQGLLSHDIVRGDECAWKADGTSFNTVKKMMSRNDINYVRYAYCKQGQLYDVTINKAPRGENDLIPIKAGLDTSKYGGYNSTKTTFFTLVRHEIKGKKVISIMPVDLLYAEPFVNKDDGAAAQYLAWRYGLINPQILPQKRIIKINSMLELDGFRLNIVSKLNKGATIGLASAIPLILEPKWENYILRLSNNVKKAKEQKRPVKISPEFDKITKEENLELYNILKSKLSSAIFKKLSIMRSIAEKLEDNLNKFDVLSVEEQVKIILNIVSVFKTGRSSGCDLKAVGCSSQSGVITINSCISNLKFEDVRIIDQSPTGLFEKRSENLMKL